MKLLHHKILSFCSNFFVVFLLLICGFYAANATNKVEFKPGYYLIELTDKNHSPYSISAPLEFLTAESVARRQLSGISINESDLPVSPVYIDSIANVVSVFYASKWFNAVMVLLQDENDLNSILDFSFYKDMVFLKPLNVDKIFDISNEKLNLSENLYLPSIYNAKGSSIKTDLKFESSLKYDLGLMKAQIEMLNGHILHKNGFWGDGVSIALFDSGFQSTDVLDAFSHLWESGRVKGHFDLVFDSEDVFNSHRHGTMVLSVMAALLPGQLAGAAPDASYWLFQTEDVKSEYWIEEANWLRAAEIADSLGVYVINSSLGYTLFDDVEQNHSYEDMDGITTIIARAAGFAYDKGMLVVNSAGNYGSGNWRYIGSPADSHGALAVGALTILGHPAAFSSVGPSYDGRVKPDVMALGYQVGLVNVMGVPAIASGTSFSSPIIAALAACLWQEFPDRSNVDIRRAITESSHKFYYPNDSLGYGTPDFARARMLLMNDFNHDDGFLLSVIPNPIIQNSYIPIHSVSECLAEYRIYNISGQLVYQFQSELIQGYNKVYPFKDIFNSLSSGMFFIRIDFCNERYVVKLVKS
ncbi:MAG: S8 family serine peptidase [Bacteroidetes bacterium]|nr:S8 family serine peptidase [Bacteroidota bacterium]